eukprot:scaffold3163_cov60-Attheya_sp.AAC.14
MAINIKVHGLVPITVAMRPRMIRVVITVMHTLRSSVIMATLMDLIIIILGLPVIDFMEQQAVVMVDSVAVVEMEVIGMTPTKMMLLLMQALIIMICQVQHPQSPMPVLDPLDGSIVTMPLDGAPVISLLLMQLLTILGLILSERLNDARAAHSFLCPVRQKTRWFILFPRTEEKVDDNFTPVILVAINTIQLAETRKALVALLDTPGSII